MHDSEEEKPRASSEEDGLTRHRAVMDAKAKGRMGIPGFWDCVHLVVVFLRHASSGNVHSPLL